MTRVAIVQEYVPAYRVPFYDRLRDMAAAEGIKIIVAAGSPSNGLGARGDAVHFEGLRIIAQRERRVLSRRFTVRSIGAAVRDADFVVLEQARRNVDAYRLLSQSRLPVALWGHGRDYVQRAAAVDRLALNWLTRRADWFFVYTEGGKEAVCSLGYPEARITVVRNSTDTAGLARSMCKIDRATLGAFTRHHDLRGKTALFIGGLDDAKRLPFLLGAAQQVADRDPDFRLLIGGAGKDEQLITDFQRKAPWLIQLGQLRGRDKALAFAVSQVIAMPGRVGLVAVDSFAAGTPIVTTDWQWHAPEFEYLQDGINAVVAANDVGSYAKALHSVLNDPARLYKLKAGALRERSRYTIEGMAERYLDGLLQWCRAPRRR